MKDLHPKFIIENRRLILGKVEFHEELATDKDKVKGGGWFYYYKEKNLFILYGKSIQFGRAFEKDIINAVKNGWADAKGYEEYYNDDNFAYFSTDLLGDALLNYVVIEK